MSDSHHNNYVMIWCFIESEIESSHACGLGNRHTMIYTARTDDVCDHHHIKLYATSIVCVSHWSCVISFDAMLLIEGSGVCSRKSFLRMFEPKIIFFSHRQLGLAIVKYSISNKNNKRQMASHRFLLFIFLTFERNGIAFQTFAVIATKVLSHVIANFHAITRTFKKLLAKHLNDTSYHTLESLGKKMFSVWRNTVPSRWCVLSLSLSLCEITNLAKYANESSSLSLLPTRNEEFLFRMINMLMQCGVALRSQYNGNNVHIYIFIIHHRHRSPFISVAHTHMCTRTKRKANKFT